MTIRGAVLPRLLERFPLLPALPLAPRATWRRAAAPIAPSLGRLGTLEVRLARDRGEVRRAQQLRYRVFYEEGTAKADLKSFLARRDSDRFDAICDHLLVIDHAGSNNGEKPAIVGTYRLLPQAVAERHGHFYTAGEFDIAPLVARHRHLRFLELGRSCVLPAYRNKRTVELLWHGIWTYVRRNGFDAMIGCASLEGTDPDALALPLSFLHHFARAPDDWRANAWPDRAVAMNRMPKDAIDARHALRALPPLLKGYLRLGASIGEDAVIDHQFGTTDVLVLLPVATISDRYVAYFGADAERHAA
jgi:putative hemolysin